MKAAISSLHGSPRLNINGREYPPIAFMTYNPTAKISADMREIGIPVFSLGIYASDLGINDLNCLKPFRAPFWIGEDEYDFTDADRQFEMAAPGGEGAFILPRVVLDAPSWWIKAHPGELCRDDRGQALRQSLCSDVWLSDAKKALGALMEHVNGSKWKECVIGYHVAAGGTEEWTHHQTQPDHQWRVDYSKSALKMYREFAGNPDIEFPALIERAEGDTNELFWRFNSHVFSHAILELCGEVKRRSGGNLLAGAFYGYLFLRGAEKGHYDMKTILNSPDIDFVASTSFGTGAGSGRPLGSFAASLRLHNKLYFNEGDIRTHLGTVLSDNMAYATPENSYYTDRNVWRGPATRFLSMSALIKAGARVLTGQAGIWWFDMFGGWFQSPAMHDFFRKFLDLYNAQEVTSLGAEIAVIVDETGITRVPLYDKDEISGRTAQFEQLDKCGAPYDVYELSDYMSGRFPRGRYKLCFFINCKYFEDDVNVHKLWLRQACTKDAYIIGRDVRASKQAGALNVFADTPVIPYETMQKIAVYAGVNLYLRGGDIVMAGGNYIAVHAVTGGEKKLRLPFEVERIEDALTGAPVSLHAGVNADLPILEYETRIFRVYIRPKVEITN